MISTEHRHSLPDGNLLVATPYAHGVDIKVYRDGSTPGTPLHGEHARPVSQAIAWTVGSGYDVKLMFGEEPNGRFDSDRLGVRAITHYAATLNAVTDGKSTFVSPGNLVLADDSSARPHLEELGFVHTEDSFTDDPRGSGFTVEPAVPISEIHSQLAGNYPAEVSGATIIAPPSDRQLAAAGAMLATA